MNSCCPDFSPEHGCSHWGPQVPDTRTTEDVKAEKQEYYEIMHGRGNRYK